MSGSELDFYEIGGLGIFGAACFCVGEQSLAAIDDLVHRHAQFPAELGKGVRVGRRSAQGLSRLANKAGDCVDPDGHSSTAGMAGV